ncbi:unnamed protein product [Polarella glacialis]|uniref:Pentacotripeptide-repeat region of PRORP domain-containing protein n=1 Tax=Polarella glacialis TaxID=89957 RepID=A0A813H5I9_POLGL|nr:unnamed protein product [Polarella glacialis]CAE8651351.1 unnamed protein product [Polarella glacialis]
MQEDSSRQIAMTKSDINGDMSVLRRMDVSDPNKLSTSVWDSAMDACIDMGGKWNLRGDIVKAKDMMQKLCSAGIADTVTYNTMLKVLVRQGQFDKALEAKDEMRRAGFLPDSSTFFEIIHGLLRSNMSSQAWEVIKEMKAAGLSPNRVLCATLAKSLNRTSSNEEINRVMQLTESMNEPMDEALLACIVEACLRVQKPSMVVNKLALLRGKDPVVISAAHTFGSIIKGYGYVKDMAGVWDCWEDMMAKKVTPSSITIGCMVEAFASNGDVDGAYDLLRSLLSHRETKNKVNSVAYGSVIKGFGRLKKMDKVLAVFEDMKSNGIAPSLMTFNSIIDGCARSGQMDKVHHLILDMKSFGLHPNLITHSTMMKGFCAKGDMGTAFEILEEVRRGPDKPDQVVYNTMMDGCVQANLVEEGEQLVAQMQAEGVAPSNYLLTGLVRLLRQAHRAERALELTQAAATKFRFKLNSHVYNGLLQACLACRAYEQGAQAVARAINDRCPVEGKFCQGIARGLLRGNVVMAVELLRSLLGLTSEGGHHRKQGVHAAALLDDAFLAEVLTALLHRASLENKGAALALLAELKTLKPTLWLEPALLRKLAERAAKSRQ